MRDSKSLAESLAVGQGAYYLATGAWPLLHMRSFLAVTGPKTDLWLVKTVGALVGVIGTALLEAGRRGRVSREMALLAGGSAAALAAVDVVYVSRGRISPVYLLDAVPELALAAAWAGVGGGVNEMRAHRSIVRHPEGACD